MLLADEAHPIGPAPSRDSYLRGEAIVRLAVEIGADAIHPGYGFLSERAEFARLCHDAGLVFIGPSAAAIAAMGSKVESRKLMIAAGVPVVPGGQEALADLAAAQSAAAEIGYPVMLKAAAGGGGKGMRMVARPADLAAAYRAARSEAAASFGDDAVYLEKLIVEPRHVEIQVMGDLYGRVVSLGERECSLQRRHQKVVEEAPSPVVTAELRRRMGAAAVAAAGAVGYSNAGTVEFLLDAEGRFFFLEMNTDVTPRGHAIEVRLYAEDPFQRFAPSPGRIEMLRLPEGPGIRNDSGVYEGSEVSIHYDPMLAKLSVWAADRERALARLGRALAELRIEGIRTTAPLYRALLADADFRAGRLDVGMLDRKLASGELRPVESCQAAALPDLPLLAAAIAHYERARRTTAVVPGGTGAAGGGRRLRWAAAGRREAVRGGPWS